MLRVEDAWVARTSTPLRGPDLVSELVVRKGETVLENNHDEWAYLQTLNNIQHINPRIEPGDEVDLIIKVTNIGNSPSSGSTAYVSSSEEPLYPSCTNCEFPYTDETVFFRIPGLQPAETWEGTITVNPDAGSYNIEVAVHGTEIDIDNNYSGVKLEVVRPQTTPEMRENSDTKFAPTTAGGSGSLSLLESLLLYLIVLYTTRRGFSFS